MTEAKTSSYWIAGNALYISLNANNDPDYITGNAVSGAHILCYIEGIEGLGYDVGHNYRRWPLAISPTYFSTISEKYVYVAIPRPSNPSSEAVVVFPSEKLDIYGKNINEEQIGSEEYYYIWLQGIITATNAGRTLEREWASGHQIVTGTLSSDEAISTGGDQTWWSYSTVDSTVTFIKKIIMDVKSSFQNLYLGGKNLTGVVTSQDTYTDSDTLVATPSYIAAQTISKTQDDAAQGLIGFVKGLWVKARGLFGIDGNGNAKVHSLTVNEDYGIDDNGDAILHDINANNIVTKTLTAQDAHFFNLIIDEVKSVGGQMIVSPANAQIGKVIFYDKDGNVVDEDDTETPITAYYLWIKKEDDKGNAITMQFESGDLILHMEFNVAQAQSRNYWMRVEAALDNNYTMDFDGVTRPAYLLLITPNAEQVKAGSARPRKGDHIAVFGNRTNAARQNAIVISAYNIPFIDPEPYNGDNNGIQAPLFVEYTGVGSWTQPEDRFKVKDANRKNVIARNGTRLRGDFQVWNSSTTEYDSVTTLIQALANSITLRVSSIENTVSNGLRNLILNSNFQEWVGDMAVMFSIVDNTAQGDTSVEQITSNLPVGLSSGIMVTCQHGYDGIACGTWSTPPQPNFPIVAGKKYTFSWWVKTTGESSLYIEADVAYSGISTSTTWERKSLTFTAKSDNNENNRITILCMNADTMYLTGFQLEEGDKMTSWRPASEDMATKGSVAELQVTTGQISGRVSTLENNQSGFVVKGNTAGIYTTDGQGNIAMIGTYENGIIKLTANNIMLEGLVTANQNFKILDDGSIEAKNGKFSGEVNIYDHDKGLTVYDGDGVERVNIQSDPIGDITQMANDTLTSKAPSVNVQTNSFNNSVSTSLDFVPAKKTIEIDDITINTIGNGSSTDYPTTYTAYLTIEIIKNSNTVHTDTVTITKTGNASYKAEAGSRCELQEGGGLTIRFSISGITNTSSGSQVFLQVFARIQTGDFVQTYIGSNGFYSHPGANKLFWFDEKELQIRFGYGGLRLSLPSGVSTKGQLDTIGGVYGNLPDYKPFWMPFHNIMPLFHPTFGTSPETIVNTGDTGKYVYKIDPFKDRGICFVDTPAYDSTFNYKESWVLLPRSTQMYNGQSVSLPEGYTITVINETSLTERKNVYVSIDEYSYHGGKIIDANNNTNYYCALNGTQCRDTYIYVGRRGSSAVWIAMHDTQ